MPQPRRPDPELLTADIMRRIEFLRSRLPSAPVIGSPERTAILLDIMSLTKKALAIREAYRENETTTKG